MGCGLRHATCLFDRLHFVGFYCLPAFVGARSHRQQQHQPPPAPPPPPHSYTKPVSRVSVQRAAAEDTPGAAAACTQGSVIQRPPAVRCAELERLPQFPFRNSHTATTAVTAARGREGVKVLNRKPDTNLSIWHGMVAGPQPRQLSLNTKQQVILLIFTQEITLMFRLSSVILHFLTYNICTVTFKRFCQTRVASKTKYSNLWL